MSRTRVVLLAGFAAALGLPSGGRAALPASAVAAPAMADSSTVRPDETVEIAGDSLQNFPSIPDSAAALGPWLDRVAVAGSTLGDGERRVLDELVAAARDMLSSGDAEATRLLAVDALDLLRRSAR